MSEHLEWYLLQFLKCYKKECCIHSNRAKKILRKQGRTDDIKNMTKDQRKSEKIKFSFLSWLCANVVEHDHPLTKPSEWRKTRDESKNRFRDDNWLIVMKVLWKKFEQYRKNPNLKQVIKIDRISENLKQFFLTPMLDNRGVPKLGLDGKPKWRVDFEKILSIFPNCREIHYFNQYAFDKIALEK